MRIPSNTSSQLADYVNAKGPRSTSADRKSKTRKYNVANALSRHEMMPTASALPTMWDCGNIECIAKLKQTEESIASVDCLDSPQICWCQHSNLACIALYPLATDRAGYRHTLLPPAPLLHSFSLCSFDILNGVVAGLRVKLANIRYCHCCWFVNLQPAHLCKNWILIQPYFSLGPPKVKH